MHMHGPPSVDFKPRCFLWEGERIVDSNAVFLENFEATFKALPTTLFYFAF